MNILGITGHANAGKDTVANVFVERYGFKRVGLADPFKRFCRRVFEFTDTQLWGPSEHRNGVDSRYGAYDSPAWADASARLHTLGRDWIRLVITPSVAAQLDERVETAFADLVEWFHWLGTHYAHDLSPRVVLQSLGSEWGRQTVCEDIWINYAVAHAKHQIVEKDAIGVVISDVRFFNELKAVKEAHGKLIRIVRPATDGLSLSTGIAGHASESQQTGFHDDEFDFLINNDGTLKDLTDAIQVYATCLGLAEL